VQSAAEWCNMISMAQVEKSVRQSVSIPSRIAKRVRALAKKRKTSANRVLVDLIEAGPKIQWTNLPPALREHLFDRLAERQITAEDLYRLKVWRESEPDAPDGL